MQKTAELIGDNIPASMWNKQLDLAQCRIVVAKGHLEKLVETSDTHAINKTYKAIRFWERMRDEAMQEIKCLQ